MEWINWLLEHFAEIWEVLVVLAGLAIYVAKKNKDGKLGEVWEWVKDKLVEFAQEALQEVSKDDVYAVAGPFWDSYLAGITVLRFFGINKEKFLALCWEQWQKFITTEDNVEVAVAKRMVLGSRAFS